MSDTLQRTLASIVQAPRSKVREAGRHRLARRRDAIIPAFEDLERKIVLSTYTWTGGGANSDWSTAANWQGGVAPTSGSTLVFGTGESRLTNVDNIAGLSVAEIVVAGGYSISGDAIAITGSGGTGIDSQSGTNTLSNAITLGASLTFTQEAGQLTLSGVISGSESLTEGGPGVLVLSGANTYSGTTTVSAGTLQVGNAGTTGALGTGAVTDNATLTFDRTNSVTVANAIGGTGSLTQAGTGTTILTGANTYSGATTISAGTLQVGNAGATGALGTGSVTDSATLSFDLTGTNTVAVGISGTGALTQAGSGTTILTGSNTYSGTTTISAGTLQVGNAGTAGSLGTGNVVDTGTLSFALTSSNAIANAISGTGKLLQSGTGTTILTGANSYSGVTTISAGVLQIGNGGTAGALGTGTVTDDALLTFDLSGNVTVAKVISGTGALSQIGSGTTTLSAANTYSGTSTVSAGTLKDGVANALPTATSLTVSGTGTFDLGGFAQNVASLADGGVTTGTVTDSGAAAAFTLNNASADSFSGLLAGALSLTKSGTGTATLSGANTYAGGTTVSAGVLNIQNSAALGANAVSVASGAALQVQGGISVSNALTLKGTGVGSAGALESVSGSNLWSGTVALSSNPSSIGVDAGQLTVSGVVSGASADTLDAVGAGTLALSATETMAGALTVAGGTLLVDGSLASMGSKALTVDSTAALGGVGTVGLVTLSGGTLNPGDAGTAGTAAAVGTLTASKAVTFGAGSALDADLAMNGTTPVADQLLVTSGNATLTNSILNLTIGSNFVAPQNAVFTILKATGSGATVGAFNGTGTVNGVSTTLSNGSTFTTAVGQTFKVTYLANALELVYLTGTTATSVAASSNPSTYGQSVTFTATVSNTGGGSAPPTGSVEFFDGTTDLGPGSALGGSGSSATSSFTISTLTAGSHTIKAVYTPTGAWVGSSGSLSQAVNQAPLTITANNQTKLYGAALPALTVTYSGFVNGDTSASLTTLPTVSTTATAASHVSASPYAITASGAVDSNYVITYAAGTLTVTPAPLTITANNQTKVYGAALPTLTASYTGFVNGDTSSSLTAQPTLTTTATPGSHVSGNPYSITASGAADNDYSISYVPGVLTVTAAPLTITANNQTKVYGAALPTLTAGFSGFVNGDTSSSLTTQPTLSTTATASSLVSGSPYSITAGGASDSDYSISYVAGSLVVTPAGLTVTGITANNKVYDGTTVATLNTGSAALVGIVGGDSVSLSTATASGTFNNPNVGSGMTVTIAGLTISGPSASNYTLVQPTTTASITPASLTVTGIAANNKVYDGTTAATLNTNAAALVGVVSGDSVTLSTAGAVGAFSDRNVGTAKRVAIAGLTIGGASASNYALTEPTTTANITPAPLTVIANNINAQYTGSPFTAFTAQYAGFVGGDTSSVVQGDPVFSTNPPGPAVSAGTYAVIPALGSLIAENYTFTTFVNGTLTIEPPAGGTRLSFQFVYLTSPDAPGFIPVQPTKAYGDGTAPTGSDYGWDTSTTVTAVDRGAPNALLRAGQTSPTPFTFHVDVTPGLYLVTPTVGDDSVGLSGINFTAQGLPVVADADGNSVVNLSTQPGQFLNISFLVAVSGTELNLGISGGTVINALQIAPAATNTIALTTPPAPQADGSTIDTINGAGAPPNTLLNVAVTGATIVSSDADPNYQGDQVLSDSNGDFSFQLQRPTLASKASIAVSAVSGTATGSASITYSVPVTRGFNFTIAGAPDAAGYTDVYTTNTYTGNAGFTTNGFGWNTASATLRAFDRGGPTPLRRDGVYGTTAEFDVQAKPNVAYTVRLYLGDPSAARNVTATVDGTQPVGTSNPIATSAGTFATPVFDVVAPASGVIAIDLTGAAFFSIVGMDIWETVAGAPGPGIQPMRPLGGIPQPAPGTPSLATSQLTPIVREAIDIWAHVGLSKQQVNYLRHVHVAIGDLTGVDMLGETTPAGIVIDATGDGAGWSVNRSLLRGQVKTGEYDLLTVVLHELGHELGLADVSPAAQPGDVMSETLATGVRLLPTHADVVAADRGVSRAQTVATAPAAHHDSRPGEAGSHVERSLPARVWERLRLARRHARA